MEASSTFTSNNPNNSESRRPAKKSVRKLIAKPQTEERWQCREKIIPKIDRKSDLKLLAPIKKEVFIFHTFKEVLRYNFNRRPVNNNIKIIGQHKISKSGIPYVQGFEEEEVKYVIFVNLQTVKVLPDIGDVIEMFGHVYFYPSFESDLTIFAILFWIKLNGDLVPYIDRLKEQRSFLPPDAFQVQTCSQEVDDPLMLLSQEFSLKIINGKI